MSEAFLVAFGATVGIVLGIILGAIPIALFSIWFEKKRWRLEEVKRIVREGREATAKMPNIRGN